MRVVTPQSRPGPEIVPTFWEPSCQKMFVEALGLGNLLNAMPVTSLSASVSLLVLV